MRKNADQSILSFISHEDKQRLMALGKPLEFKEGRNLFFRGDKGDSFYIILAGSVTIGLSTDEGREIILNKLSPGDIFGEITMFDQAERTTDAYAVAGTKLISIDRENFLGFLDKNPALYREIVAFLCRQLRHFSGHVENLVLSNSFERLVAKLVLVAKTNGQNRSAVIETSQSDLAKMLGLSREVVNKNLQELRIKNLLELKRKKIYIPDVEKLGQLQKSKAG